MTHGGNFAKLIIGARRYMGHRLKSIKPDKGLMSKSFGDPYMGWAPFVEDVIVTHQTRTGLPEETFPNYDLWENPLTPCMLKHDCVFGDDFDLNEISYVSEVLREFDRPIVYSLSPGTNVTPAMAKDVSGLVNLYRITADDWDNWMDVKRHFDVSRDFASANMIGAKSLMGNSWPDLDMLPFGWLTDPNKCYSINSGPYRYSNLNLEEKRTQMTLWAMAKSPLMYGGDVGKIDPTTYDLITNPTLLEINSFSTNNIEA
ncbi:alpha-galactosidase 1-like protein, partial [Trifolium pratense]